MKPEKKMGTLKKMNLEERFNPGIDIEQDEEFARKLVDRKSGR